MKIAVPTRDGVVDDHFGHCAEYTIYMVDSDRNVVAKDRLPSPQGCGCKSNIASVLRDMGVGVMLAGNMGAGALNVLTKHEIKVLRGCSGSTDDLVASYLAGAVSDSGEQCRSHGEDHQCSHTH